MPTREVFSPQERDSIATAQTVDLAPIAFALCTIAEKIPPSKSPETTLLTLSFWISLLTSVSLKFHGIHANDMQTLLHAFNKTTRIAGIPLSPPHIQKIENIRTFCVGFYQGTITTEEIARLQEEEQRHQYRG